MWDIGVHMHLKKYSHQNPVWLELSWGWVWQNDWRPAGNYLILGIGVNIFPCNRVKKCMASQYINIEQITPDLGQAHVYPWPEWGKTCQSVLIIGWSWPRLSLVQLSRNNKNIRIPSTTTSTSTRLRFLLSSWPDSQQNTKTPKEIIFATVGPILNFLLGWKSSKFQLAR